VATTLPAVAGVGGIHPDQHALASRAELPKEIPTERSRLCPIADSAKLRRYHRDHEGDHRPRPRTVGLTRPSTKPVLHLSNAMLDEMLEPAASAESVSGSGGSWRPLRRTALSVALAHDRNRTRVDGYSGNALCTTEPVFAAFFLGARRDWVCFPRSSSARRAHPC
jgi:hypothetical protein